MLTKARGLFGWFCGGRLTRLTFAMGALVAALPAVGCVGLGETIDRLIGVGREGDSKPNGDGALRTPVMGEAEPSPAAGGKTAPSRRASADQSGAPPAQPAGPRWMSKMGTTSGTDPDAETVTLSATQHLARLVHRGMMTELYVPVDRSGARRSDRYFVQIGSYKLLSAAEDQLRSAEKALTPLLLGRQLQVRRADLGSGRFYRVHVGPFESQHSAHDFCRALKGLSRDCWTIAQSGTEPDRPARRAELSVEWASIAPDAPRKAPPRMMASVSGVADQIADALPLYTAPGLAGLPE